MTVATTGENLPLLTGTLCSIAVSAIVCIVVSPAILLPVLALPVQGPTCIDMAHIHPAQQLCCSPHR